MSGDIIPFLGMLCICASSIGLSVPSLFVIFCGTYGSSFAIALAQKVNEKVVGRAPSFAPAAATDFNSVVDHHLADSDSVMLYIDDMNRVGYGADTLTATSGTSYLI